MACPCGLWSQRDQRCLASALGLRRGLAAKGPAAGAPRSSRPSSQPPSTSPDASRSLRAPHGMSLGVRIMVAKAGRPPWTIERQADMTNHNGVLMMQRLLLAGTLGLAVAQKAAAILDGEPASADPLMPVPLLLDEPAGSRSAQQRRRGAAGDPGRGQRVPGAFRRPAAGGAVVRRAAPPARPGRLRRRSGLRGLTPPGRSAAQGAQPAASGEAGDPGLGRRAGYGQPPRNYANGMGLGNRLEEN